MVKRLLIVKVGSAPPDLAARKGDFEDWFARGLGVSIEACRVVDPRLGEALPNPSELDAVLVTGSASMVTDRAEWSLRTTRWLRDVANHAVPTLGVCYGHQLLAEALGGEVAPNPRGRQMGTIDVKLLETDPVLGSDPMHVVVTHVESVVRLPPEAKVLATSAGDPHHAFRVRNALGVQFHPEMDAEIIRYYLNARREALASELLDADALIEAARDTNDGTELLRRWLQWSR